MATYVQPCNKRQKTVREPVRSVEVTEYFPGINKIEYKGDTAAYDETLCYRYFNASERVHGRTMEDWIRPAVSLTAFKYNGMDSYGKPTFHRSWDDHSQSLENYKRYLKAGFEFCTKLGVKHWCAYDRDLIPEMDTFEENVISTDEITEFLQEMQQRTGIKPLWIAPDLHTSPKYASGSATSYDSNIMMQAAQQVKRCLETSHKLNSECFLIWAGREGCHSLLNTDIPKEMKHFARLLKMTSDFKERLGYRGQLLLQPWKKSDSENMLYNHSCETDGKTNDLINMNDGRGMRHYIWDVTSGLCFLKHYNLDRHYKICTKPGYQFYLSSTYNITGSIEITPNDQLDVKDATLMMKNIIEQGGIQPGGISIRVVPNRDCVDAKDMFLSYISCVDTLARGLRIATKMLTDQTFTKNLQQRYISYYSGFGSRLSNGEASLEECEEQVRKLQNQCPENVITSRQGHWDLAFKNFIHKTII